MSGTDLKAGTILTAQSAIDADPAFGKSVMLVLVQDEDHGTVAVNIAGKQLLEAIHDGGPEGGGRLHCLFKAPPGGATLGDTGFSHVPVASPESEEAKIIAILADPETVKEYDL